MLNFKNYLMQCLIEGEINVTHKENIPTDGEEHWDLLKRFLDGEYIPKTDIEARNITKWANERNIGKERLLSLFDRLTNGNHRIKSRTHATEAMVGLAQNAHKDDPSYASHREALLNKGGRIAMEAQKAAPLKVRSAVTGERVTYKVKEPSERNSSKEGTVPSQPMTRDKLTKVDPNTEVSFSHESTPKGGLGVLSSFSIFAHSKYGGGNIKHHIGTVVVHANDDVTSIAHPHGADSNPEKVTTTSGQVTDTKNRVVDGVNQIRQHYTDAGHIPTDAIDEQGFPITLHRGGHEKGDKYKWEPTGIPEHDVVGAPAAVHNRRGKSIVELVDENGRRHFVHADELSSLTDRRPVAELHQTRF